MRIEEYEVNQRKIALRSDKPKKSLCKSTGSFKKKYYEEEKIDILEVLLQRMINDLFIMGHLKNEIKVSVDFEDSFGEEIVSIELDVVK